MTELEAYKLLVESCFKMTVNLNDTFYYASADAETIEDDDSEELIPYIKKYGHDAIVAYVAIKRDHDPIIPQHITKDFKAAKKELKELAKDGTIFFDRWYRKNNK